jgi:hypothetical protein
MKFFVTQLLDVLVEAFVIYLLILNYYNYDYSQLPKKQNPIQPQILPCNLPPKINFLKFEQRCIFWTDFNTWLIEYHSSSQFRESTMIFSPFLGIIFSKHWNWINYFKEIGNTMKYKDKVKELFFKVLICCLSFSCYNIFTFWRNAKKLKIFAQWLFDIIITKQNKKKHASVFCNL